MTFGQLSVLTQLMPNRCTLLSLLCNTVPFFIIPNSCLTKESNLPAFGPPKHSQTKKTKTSSCSNVFDSNYVWHLIGYQHYCLTEHLILWISAEYYRCLWTVEMCWQNRQSSELDLKSPFRYSDLIIVCNDRPREYISGPARSHLLSTWHFVVFGPFVGTMPWVLNKNFAWRSNSVFLKQSGKRVCLKLHWMLSFWHIHLQPLPSSFASCRMPQDFWMSCVT